MKRLAALPPPGLLLLGLVVLLAFGNCSQNVYRLLGPGTTPQQVARLKQLNDSTYAAYRLASQRPDSAPGPTPRQAFAAADSARRRLLSPAQYRRWQTNHSVLPLRYPRRPPRAYR